MIADTFSSFSVQIVGAKEMILPYADDTAGPETPLGPLEDGEVEVELGWIIDDVGTGQDGPLSGSDADEDEFGYRWLMEHSTKTRPRKEGDAAQTSLAYDRAGGVGGGPLPVLGAGADGIKLAKTNAKRQKKDQKVDLRAFRAPKYVLCLHLC